MRIGDELVRVAGVNGHLITTGHSLGGGLASAAAVAANIPANTFNAAGLHINSLYRRDDNGEIVIGENGSPLEIYPGSVTRYNNASTFIVAYHVDYDLLSLVQDLTPLPDALGTRIEMDGPHDIDIGFDVGIIVAAAAFGQPWGVTAGQLFGLADMVHSHFMEVVLYGKLVKENFFGVVVEDLLGYDL